MSEHADTWVDELPPRPRMRLLTPITGGLLAVLLVAGGFIAGVLVEKGQKTTGGTGSGGLGRAALSARPGAGAGPGGFAAGGDSGGTQPTFGQVANVQGRTLYVTTAQGNTVKVTVPKGASVTRTISGSVKNVHPGETVVIQGAQKSDGSISATSVRATSSSAGGGGSSGGGGGNAVLNQLFGGGGGK